MGRRRPPVRKKNRTAIRRSDGGKAPRPTARKSPHGEPESKTRPPRNGQGRPTRGSGRKSSSGEASSGLAERPGPQKPCGGSRNGSRIRTNGTGTSGRTGRETAGPEKARARRRQSPPSRRIVFGPGSSDEEKSSTHARPETTPAFACPSPERTAHLHGPACSDPACPAGRPAERTAVPDGKRTRRSDTRSEDRFFSMYVTLS